jgi:tRNA(Ile)-lysidine synthase
MSTAREHSLDPGAKAAPRAGSLPDRVLHNLTQRCGVQRGDRVLVAVSGGRDSVALAHVLRELSPRLRIEIEIAHFDHCRRPDSGHDAEFTRGLAAQLGVRFHTERWRRPASGEDAARTARYGFLERIAREHALDAIAVAHQQRDQVETLLVRLGRGAGVRGLGGMSWRRDGAVPIVRPFLDVARGAITTYLEQHGYAWREDPTNTELGPTRNRVRHVAMPALVRALGTTWADRAWESMEHLSDVWDWMQSEAAAAIDAACGGDPRRLACKRSVLRQAPTALRPVILQLWLEGLGVRNLTRKHLVALSDLAENGQSGHEVALPDGWTARVSDTCLDVDRSAHATRPKRPRRADGP